jgi:hypothetical protein
MLSYFFGPLNSMPPAFFSRLDYSPGRIKTLSFLLGGTGPVLLFGSKDPLNMQGGS